jgi:hypothetical protein
MVMVVCVLLQRLQHFGVVAAAVGTLVVQKVVFCLALFLAIIAKYGRHKILVFWGHLSLLQHEVYSAEIVRHVAQRLETSGALIGRLNIFHMAIVVDTVTARLKRQS